jgi:hypothetical protein
MKKIILLSITIISLFTASCRKERTCNCTVTEATGNTTTTYSYSYTQGHATKSEAKRGPGSFDFITLDCYSSKEVETDGGVQTITTKDCKLK